ncbi:(d)CMP kinase [Anaerotaenia torta]|uniref:(d)CMP kinase n=1 Tax=Anaerotaenia torta TaxID=433293 RepID=UPI003D1D1BF2
MFNIAIDGPAGAGKSTIAKILARKLNFIYVDTGAMYRAMALYFLRNNIDASDSGRIEAACKEVDITLEYRDGEQVVLLNGERVNEYIRTEEVGNMASASSVNKAVRLKLVELQQSLAKKESVVMDGRDIGTYVLPRADLKIYLTAGTRERARRRWAELREKGQSADMDVIEQDIIDRDHRDMTREFAPLRQAEDAVFLDSSHMSIDEVVEYILELYRSSCNRKEG